MVSSETYGDNVIESMTLTIRGDDVVTERTQLLISRPRDKYTITWKYEIDGVEESSTEDDGYDGSIQVGGLCDVRIQVHATQGRTTETNKGDSRSGTSTQEKARLTE